MVNIENVRENFPIFRATANDPPIYFDNASTTHKPQCVIDEVANFYSNRYSNIHRGLYPLSLNASEEYEYSRENIRRFLNARCIREIIFTKGTTEGINLLSHCLEEYFFKEGDEIILSILEHHSNIVPWQILAKKRGLKLIFIGVDSNCDICIDKLYDSINPKTKLISITHISNSIGTINPVEEIIKIARQRNVLVLIDGAQSVGHSGIDVQKMDCDFFVFSGHKVYGPTGTGVLYAKEEHLNKFPPYQSGGNQIKSVSIVDTQFADLPFKFEPGTPNISGFIGLSKAIDFVDGIGFDVIESHERKLTNFLLEKMSLLPDYFVIGNPDKRSGIMSICLPGKNPIDVGILLGQAGVCIRAGLHCNEPLMDFLNMQGTIRISLAIYNTLNEMELLLEKLDRVQKLLNRISH